MLTNVPPTPPDAWISFQDEAQFAERPEIALLEKALGNDYLGWSGFQGNLSIAINPSALLDALRLLRDEASYDHFSFMTCAHWIETPAEAFQVVYQLFSRTHQTWVRIQCFLPEAEHPTIDSATVVYPAADWHESECYDLFGLDFTGHPELRRLFTPGMYDRYPLRRDFPLEGAELRDFQKEMIAQYTVDADNDYKATTDDQWMDRWTS